VFAGTWASVLLAILTDDSLVRLLTRGCDAVKIGYPTSDCQDVYVAECWVSCRAPSQNSCAVCRLQEDKRVSTGGADVHELRNLYGSAVQKAVAWPVRPNQLGSQKRGESMQEQCC
jgi:hypothetical protein